MTRNLSSLERVLRSLAALPLLTCSVFAPLPLLTRLLIMALPAAYLLFTALAGSCLGYKRMGRSTCRTSQPQR